MADVLTPRERSVVDRMRTRLLHLVWSESAEDDLATLHIIDRLCSRFQAPDDAEVEAVRERWRERAGTSMVTLKDDEDMGLVFHAYDAMRAERDEAMVRQSVVIQAAGHDDQEAIDAGVELAALRRLRDAVESEETADKYGLTFSRFGRAGASMAITAYRARLLEAMKGGTP